MAMALTAGSLTVFINEGSGSSGFNGGLTFFFFSSTAGNGTFINNGSAVSGAGGGVTEFGSISTAANATLIANGGPGGGNGGSILFLETSKGEAARMELVDNGSLDIGGHGFAGTGVGSIEGNGFVFLGHRNLTVGRNNLSTTFSGLIPDRGGMARRGSLTKIGTGTLTLAGANTYKGGTLIERGTLLVNSHGGSGTGIGAVQVNGGRLGGTGTMGGAVTVGTASGTGAILSPGISGAGTLTIVQPRRDLQLRFEQ
jgi:autotransporter-associated beta strand protein